MQRKALWIVLVLVVVRAAPVAHADSFASTIGTPNAALSGFSGPFGEVTVFLNTSTIATVTFTSDTANGNIYLFGGTGAVDFNVNSSSFAVFGFFPGNAPGPGFLNSGGLSTLPGNVDGFGVFNLAVDFFDGFTASSDNFGVVVSGGPWASAADVLTPNADGFDAAAHIFVTSSPANAANGALATGFAAEGPSVTAPEPSSMCMLGLGLLGAFGFRRRKIRV